MGKGLKVSKVIRTYSKLCVTGSVNKGQRVESKGESFVEG
jgi:hypothetical protein